MTHLNQLARHTTTAARPRAARPAHASAREARTRRSFDGVLASYVRELSAASHTTSSQRAGRRTI